MQMKYEYQNDYDTLSETCPPDSFESLRIDPVFRWVFDDINHKNNFISQYHRKPKRFLNKSDSMKCKAMGLSFFSNVEGAINRYKDLRNQLGDGISETLGTKIAVGYVTEQDGVNGDFDAVGHFTHHPCNTEKYQKIFEIIQDLK